MIKRLFNWLNQSGRSLHLFAGFGILAVSMIIFGLCNIVTWLNVIISCVITLIVAIGKEVYDKVVKRTYFDWGDVLATMLFPLFTVIVCAIGYLIALI